METDIQAIDTALKAFSRIGTGHGYDWTAIEALEAWERVKERLKEKECT